MSKILEFPCFTLKDGVKVDDFLVITQTFHDEFLAKQNGFISHKLLTKENVWYQLVIWASPEEMEKAFNDIYESDAAAKFIECIDQIGSDDDIPLFSIVKEY